MTFQACLRDVQHALQRIKEGSTSKNLANFSAKAREAALVVLQNSLEKLKQTAYRLDSPLAPMIQKKTEELVLAPLDKKYHILESLAKLAAELEEPIVPVGVKVPGEIRSEIMADLSEAEKCFNAGCFRSAIVLCGRILETALHHKYYAATGQDLLEKAPGTGLGSLIAKLSEKGVALPPGLSNQVHLVNQVRVFSVHTKQEAFMPTKAQAQAIMLFTIDVLNKLHDNDKTQGNH